MFFSALLVAVASLSSFVFGDDDPVIIPGVTYFIQNTVTGFVINDANLVTSELAPGSVPYALSYPLQHLVILCNALTLFKIVSTPINASDPRGQLWTVELVSEPEDDDEGSVFNLLNPGLNVRLFATGLPGSGITVQAFSSAFQVTPIDDLDGAFTIAFPFINEAITTSSIPGQQLTLQPLNALNPFQQWAFVSFGPLPPDPDDDFAPAAANVTETAASATETATGA
ncbi:hypothetical protein AURDEDRAFT_154636 [Auricularia subglabra TFB-10046 SS5]|uniref:Uncharacterized protein n=1 Tax=Auricularia subglabra (strain TFB-10046 / SS5) TaxID=717982 RepID=J0LFX3_AURST|nr:hypothetical protein AURDEDRAFT_154636 [Auricularia subglabra TFB-10046 SS5]